MPPEALRARARDSVVSRVIDGQAVLVALDEHVVHELNAVGSRVWELMPSHTVGEMADRICTEFEVDRPTAVADIVRFLEQLRKAGMVDLEGAAP
ncbi:MAG: PqqD family protein [Myxococcota bacterium]